MPRDFQLKAVFERVFAFDIGFVEEYVFDRCPEYAGNSERHFQRRRMLTTLNGVDRLTAHADEFRQLLLRHLTEMESALPNSVGKRHDSQCPTTERALRSGLENRLPNPAAE